MKPFTYERARTPREAAVAARTNGAKFIAGGTNLLDLMKLEIETPTHLIDVNGLALDKIETTEDGGLRIGALVRNTDLAADPTVRKNYPLLSRALLAGAPPGSCATRRQPPATFFNARDAPIFMIRTSRATNVSPAAVARRLAVTLARSRSSEGARPASQRTRATWPSQCGRSTLKSRLSNRTGASASSPSPTFTVFRATPRM